MAEMQDCLVNYFSGDATEDGSPRMYICYHVLGGPGPVENGGVAAVTLLTASGDRGLCESCIRLHAVKEGGPAAALQKALNYLDDFHADSYLRKVQTEIRTFSCREQEFGGAATLAAPRIEAAVVKVDFDAGEPVTLLDARSDKAWQTSDLRIPGSIRVDRDHLQIDPAWPKDRLTVAYCTCPRDAGAAEVAGRLRKAGFSRAYVMRGGFEAWQAADGALDHK